MAFDRSKSQLIQAEAGTRFIAPIRRFAPARAEVRGSGTLALAAIVIASLGLSACGRNGAPELPPGPAIQAVPSASNAPQPAAPPGTSASTEVPAVIGAPPNPAATSQAVAAKTGFDAEGNPVAAPGQKKPFLLDPLLR